MALQSGFLPWVAGVAVNQVVGGSLSLQLQKISLYTTAVTLASIGYVMGPCVCPVVYWDCLVGDNEVCESANARPIGTFRIFHSSVNSHLHY